MSIQPHCLKTKKIHKSNRFICGFILNHSCYKLANNIVVSHVGPLPIEQAKSLLNHRILEYQCCACKARRINVRPQRGVVRSQFVPIRTIASSCLPDLHRPLLYGARCSRPVAVQSRQRHLAAAFQRSGSSDHACPNLARWEGCHYPRRDSCHAFTCSSKPHTHLLANLPVQRSDLWLYCAHSVRASPALRSRLLSSTLHIRAVTARDRALVESLISERSRAISSAASRHRPCRA